MLLGQVSHPKHQDDPIPCTSFMSTTVALAASWRNWRNRDCHYGGQEQMASLKDSGPVFFPASSPASSPDSQQLLWLSLCALAPVFLPTLPPSGEAP